MDVVLRVRGQLGGENIIRLEQAFGPKGYEYVENDYHLDASGGRLTFRTQATTSQEDALAVAQAIITRLYMHETIEIDGHGPMPAPALTPAVMQPKPTPSPSLYPFMDGAKWGYIDSSGAVKVKPHLQRALSFGDGHALAEVEQGQWAVVSVDGSLTPLQLRSNERVYEVKGRFADGVIPLHTMRKDRSEVGYLDASGAWRIEPRFRSAGTFAYGRATVCAHGLSVGIIDAQGHWVLEPSHSGIDAFSEGLAAFSAPGGKQGYLDTEGRVVIAARFNYAEPFHDGRASVEGKPTRSVRGPQVIIDEKGEKLCEPMFRIGPFGNGLAPAMATQGSRFSFINRDGFVALEQTYEFAGAFSGGLAPAVSEWGNGWGYIDVSGAFVIREQFDGAEPFDGELARVLLRESRPRGQQVAALINRKGTVLKKWFESDGVVEGRPLRVTVPATFTHERHASDAHEHAIAKWRDKARAEHESVAAFTRLSLELLALGAPDSLIAGCQRASVQELRHASLCRDTVALLQGHDEPPAAPMLIAVAPFVTLDAPRAMALAIECVLDGCLNEGIAAASAAWAAEHCDDDRIASTQRALADDEAEHAELSWQIAEWLFAQHPSAQARASAALPMPERPSAVDEVSAPFGLTPDSVVQCLSYEVCTQVRARLEHVL